MSGKRQHFIPRFLQKGFASRSIGGETFVWVFRKGVSPYNPNINNVGVEGYFYSEGEDTEVDDSITEAEGQFANLIDQLRTESTARVPGTLVANLIAHLEIRTKHLRESALLASEYFTSRILGFVADDGPYVDRLEKRLLSDKSALRAALTEEFAKRGMPLHFVEPALTMAAPRLPAMMPGIRAELAKIAQIVRQRLPNTLEKSAKSAHINLLRKNVSPEQRAQRYAALQYAVLELPGSGFVLGDSIVLFRVSGQRRYKAFPDKDDVLEAVFLPLSSERILMGAPGATFALPPELKQGIARCSMDHFIASENTQDNRDLHIQVGEDAALATESEMEEIIQELLDQDENGT